MRTVLKNFKEYRIYDLLKTFGSLYNSIDVINTFSLFFFW